VRAAATWLLRSRCRGVRKQPGVDFLNDATDENLPAGLRDWCEILEQLPATSAIFVRWEIRLIRGIAAQQAARAASEDHRRASGTRSGLLSIVEGRKGGRHRNVRHDCRWLATRTPEAANVHDVKRLSMRWF